MLYIFEKAGPIRLIFILKYWQRFKGYTGTGINKLKKILKTTVSFFNINCS